MAKTKLKRALRDPTPRCQGFQACKHPGTVVILVLGLGFHLGAILLADGVPGQELQQVLIAQDIPWRPKPATSTDLEFPKPGSAPRK